MCFSHQMSVLVGAVVGPQRNNFEQVSSGGHQMSIARGEGFMSDSGQAGAGGPVQWGTMHRGQWSMGVPVLLTDRHEWKHYIPVTSLAGDKMVLKCVYLYNCKELSEIGSGMRATQTDTPASYVEVWLFQACSRAITDSVWIGKDTQSK